MHALSDLKEVLPSFHFPFRALLQLKGSLFLIGCSLFHSPCVFKALLSSRHEIFCRTHLTISSLLFVSVLLLLLLQALLKGVHVLHFSVSCLFGAHCICLFLLLGFMQLVCCSHLLVRCRLLLGSGRHLLFCLGCIMFRLVYAVLRPVLRLGGNLGFFSNLFHQSHLTCCLLRLCSCCRCLSLGPLLDGIGCRIGVRALPG
mmetsp:Transcript_5977/g.10748  ORF Transcript_5977/g.10748 Transcript_5977/m.10748 type:complete len:201 (-) Transcript_5977:27-629(-)